MPQLLDINTPRGQQTLNDANEAMALFARKYPGYLMFTTPTDGPATVDGVMTLATGVINVCEIKCRYDLTLDKFRGEYGGYWLVTFEKIAKAREIAAALDVGLVGMLYLVADHTLLVKRLWSRKTGWEVEFGVRKTETRATVNGGLAVRDNAFIDMNTATIVEEDQHERQ